MTNKTYIVDFDLRPLLASHYFHSEVVEASNIGLAVNRAWAEVKKKTHVKGKRIKEIKISVQESVDST